MDISTKADAKIITEACREALEKVAADLGLTVKIGGGRYDPTVGTFVPKISFSTADSAERLFARLAPSWGLEPDDIGKRFTSGRRTFTISGIRERARKQPILATDEGGQTYQFETAAVLRGLGRDVPSWLP